MPIPKKVLGYLKKAKVKFEGIGHKTVYTAYDLAQTLKKDLQEVAKTLVVKADNVYKLVIVPAASRLDLKKLKKVLGAKKLSIVDEKTMSKVFKIKPGAISAFGTLHKAETLVDKGLMKVRDAIFQVGNFTDSVRIGVKDFVNLEKAQLENFAQKAKYKLQKKTTKKK